MRVTAGFLAALPATDDRRTLHSPAATLAAIIVTDLSRAKTRHLALPRLAGTLVGAGLHAALSEFLEPGAWAVGLGVLAAMLACYLLQLNDAVKLAGYVCGIVMLDHGHEPWSYAVARLLETVLGLGVAVAVSVVPKLLRPGVPRPPAG